MFELLRVHQVDVMLGLACVCLIIAFFTIISTIMTKRRKTILILMQIGSAIWLEADRIAYKYHGVPGTEGYYAVRISNFLVFLMTVFVLNTVSVYLGDVIKNEGGFEKTPIALKITYGIGVLAMILVVVSQFTGLYYTFDENNTYQRSPYYVLSFVFPYMIFLIQFGMLIYYRKRLKGRIALSIFLFVLASILTSIIQLFAYGISLVDMVAVFMVVMIYAFALVDMNERVEMATKAHIANILKEQAVMRKLSMETATALANGVDLGDDYGHGHSVRVAEYAKEISRLAGFDDRKCDEVYYCALLHDVGKIGIPDEIIKKDTDLTPEEFEIFKTHTTVGSDILSGASDFPLLALASKYHHERYDGKGYPEGLVGDNIPEIARIIAVADAYDSMTSRHHLQDPLPQSTVREEIAKEIGSAFDPVFGEIMISLIDHDTEYLMREKDFAENAQIVEDLTHAYEMYFTEYKEHISEGIQATEKVSKIHFDYQPEMGFDEKKSIPALIVYDAHDGCVHKDERSIRLIKYLEYGEIWLDGNYVSTAARNMKVNIAPLEEQLEKKNLIHYDIETVRFRDHVRIKITDGSKMIDAIIALPDAIRFCYVAITGEHCHIMNIKVEENGETADKDTIPRIAEEVSYIDRIEGDIPNVQIEGYRSGYSQPVPVIDGMRVKFRTKSLPTANLIWHCAFMLLFSSEDGLPEGEGYVEHGCLRLDGEDATNNDIAVNEVTATKDDSFKGWDGWKKANKKGFECEVRFSRRKNRITMETYNAGITMKSTTTIPPTDGDVYLALTGDQCALTDIRVLT
ncbi:HD domain-containing protein [Butyrivibrio sp. CB08]|uniref:HD domain-containing phosphohydrolase n=1 Tax=Butyrivibrio sp. CB08 TaxID=2364879 RepID=UPI000EA86DF2|nr:HD domain-containing phosphohydrolase [Butyrivibrio sp. CB08]RKM62195.1 HD domain-containing protein [Butyrivibrio sp. CB08]